MRLYLVAQAWFSQLVKHEDILGIREGEQLRLYLAGCNGGQIRPLKHHVEKIKQGENDVDMYLAGGISGNLKPMWSRTVEKLQDGMQYEEATEEAMRIYMAGNYPAYKGFPRMYDDTIKKYKPYILESFYYVDSDTERLLPYFGDFLLDSGAFTFMENSKVRVDWDEYIERYAGFIKRNKIAKYFELDIDKVVGYDKVIEYRHKLEKLTGTRCIPVWHKSRGIDEYYRMCQEYDYAAIGGIVSREIRPENYGALPKLITEAHRRKCKIHGLGFTALNWLPRCHFDSVDSTAWTTGNRFGYVYKFNGKTMIKVDCPAGKRLSDPRTVALINYNEWIKFQKYAETNL